MESNGDYDTDDWLQTAPTEGLLETDIAENSYNATKAWRTTPTTKLSMSKAVLGGEGLLAGLTISDTAPMNDIAERGKCGVCAASRMYFCYTCHVALPEVAQIIPRIDPLPIKVDIVKHGHEVDGKVSEVFSRLRYIIHQSL